MINWQETFQKYITTLRAENEYLQQYYDDMQGAIYEFREDHAKVKFFKNEIKAEAYKECIEKVKEQCNKIPQYHFNLLNVEWYLDNLLKELVGEDK